MGMLWKRIANPNDSLVRVVAVPLLIGCLILQRAAGTGEIEAADAAARRGDCETAQTELRGSTERGGPSPSDVRLPASLENLGQCWTARGRYDEAELAFEGALEARQRIHGPDHPSVAQDLHAIGWLNSRSGRYERADRFLQRALATHTASVGADHPDSVQTLGDLAFLRYQEGRIDEAEQLNLRALRIRERTLGPENLAVAESKNLAGLIARSRGRMSEAEREFERALAIHDGMRRAALSRQLPFGLGERLSRLFPGLGRDHPDVGSILSNLADVQAAQGRVSEAVRSMERAVGILEDGLGVDHPYLGSALGNLASLYRRQGESQLAERTHARTVAILRRALPRDHPQLVAAERSLMPACQEETAGCSASN